MKYIRVFILTIIIQMKSSWARPMFRFTMLINPIATTIIICEMFISSGEENFGGYIILGAGLMSLWTNICFSSIGDINRERWMGTLPYLYSSLAEFNLIICAKMLGNIILSLISVIITVISSYLLYGVKIDIEKPFILMLSLVLTITGFAIISMFVAYIMLLTRKTPLYMNLIDMPLIILSGFVFPISILPRPVQMGSYLLLPTWLVKLLTEVLEAGQNSVIQRHIFVILIMMILYISITFVLWKVIKKRIKKTASLEVF